VKLSVAAFSMTALLCFGCPAVASEYSDSLRATAAALDRVASVKPSVPNVHVPPAPLGGPPRYSPSVDDWLQAALSAAQRRHDAKARTASLRSTAATLRYLAASADARGSVFEPRHDVGATTASILSDPAYRATATTAAPKPKESYWRKWLASVLERIAQMLAGVVTATQRVPFLGTIFATVLIALAVVGLAYVGFKIAEGLVFRRRAITATEGEPLPANATTDQLRSAAVEAAAAGNYARAVALLFHASLVLLDRAGKVAYDPARTAGEYRRVVRRKVQWVSTEFDALAHIFTAAAYAQDPIEQPAWERAVTAFSGISRPLGDR
jgi:uncharacterized protein DUF4129